MLQTWCKKSNFQVTTNQIQIQNQNQIQIQNKNHIQITSTRKCHTRCLTFARWSWRSCGSRLPGLTGNSGWTRFSAALLSLLSFEATWTRTTFWSYGTDRTRKTCLRRKESILQWMNGTFVSFFRNAKLRIKRLNNGKQKWQTTERRKQLAVKDTVTVTETETGTETGVF